MPSTKKEVDDLQEKLKDFISTTVKVENFDVVIPIMRKGLFLLDRLFPKERMFRTLLFDPIEDRLPASIMLKDKTVLILDDSARTGRTVLEAKESIISNNSADPEKIRIGIFMKNVNCQAKIDYCDIIFDEKNGSELYGLLSAYFDSLCHQLDPDHLVIRGELRSKSIFDQKQILLDIKTELERFGSYYPQDSICTLWGRSKFGVFDLRASDFGLNAYDKYWTEEGVFKIRFCLEPNLTMFTVPIFCPEIMPPNLPDPAKCVSLIPSRFCESIELSSDALCRDCINFNLTRKFAEEFIPLFKKRLLSYGISYNIIEITWPEIELRYEGLRNRLQEDFRDSKQKMN
jgi:hypoxanthine phosphoribosyltransferase